MDRKLHWDAIYEKPSDVLSWYQAEPAASLRLIDAMALPTDSHVVDIGGGDSRLVDALIGRGFTDITVLDVSSAAIDRGRTRLASNNSVRWIEADVTGEWDTVPVDLWHDRAVFHFLVESADRRRYLAHLHKMVKPSGHVLIATFSLDGPTTCSRLPVVRYSSQTLSAELGPEFRVIDAFTDAHRTPAGSVQPFSYVWFRRAS